MNILCFRCVQSRWANLKKELLTTIIPMFLSNHPNSVPVLQAAWHCAAQSQNVRGLVLHAMAEWYMRGEPHDQARLSRILDVAQDLKVCYCIWQACVKLFQLRVFRFKLDWFEMPVHLLRYWTGSLVENEGTTEVLRTVTSWVTVGMIDRCRKRIWYIYLFINRSSISKYFTSFIA